MLTFFTLRPSEYALPLILIWTEGGLFGREWHGDTNLRRGTGGSERQLRSETSGGPQNFDRRALQRLAGKGDTGVERDGRIRRQLLEPRLDREPPVLDEPELAFPVEVEPAAVERLVVRIPEPPARGPWQSDTQAAHAWRAGWRSTRQRACLPLPARGSLLEVKEPMSGTASGPWSGSVDLANHALITGGAAAANDGPMLAGVPAYDGLAVVIDETQMRFR